MNYTQSMLLNDIKKGSKKKFIPSLEYELIAGLALQQYVKNDQVDFVLLFSIPLKNRIPGLINEYGLKRMHQLVKTILDEFCYSTFLPKSKKFAETNSSVCAIDLILIAQEDQFSLEDLIIFFELAKQGKYQGFKRMLTHSIIIEKLDQYRQERYEAYTRIKEEKETKQKSLGPLERISPEPTAIRHLFEVNTGKIIPLKKIS
jgi:hypothetical protein